MDSLDRQMGRNNEVSRANSVERKKLTSFQWLSYSLDLASSYSHMLPSEEMIPIYEAAQNELAQHANGVDIHAQALESFKREFVREVGEFPEGLKQMIARSGHPATLEDTARQYANDESWIAYEMARIVRDTCDPRTPEYLAKYFPESNRRMEGYFEDRERQEETTNFSDWSWTGPKGAWREVASPRVSWTRPDALRTYDESLAASTRVWGDVAQYWGLNGAGPHNEGILRDHRLYEGLYNKWALRYLRSTGQLSRERYNGKVSSRGNLLDAENQETRDNLRRITASARDTIDSAVAEELMVREGFIDITNDPDRRDALGIHPVRPYEE